MITENTTILEAMGKNPKSIQVFVKHGMKCLGWGGVTRESIGQVAREQGINLESILDELQSLDNS